LVVAVRHRRGVRKAAMYSVWHAREPRGRDGRRDGEPAAAAELEKPAVIDANAMGRK
jgi:hypothetical protein